MNQCVVLWINYSLQYILGDSRVELVGNLVCLSECTSIL